jgi:hypothetical protein
MNIVSKASILITVLVVLTGAAHPTLPVSISQTQPHPKTCPSPQLGPSTDPPSMPHLPYPTTPHTLLRQMLHVILSPMLHEMIIPRETSGSSSRTLFERTIDVALLMCTPDMASDIRFSRERALMPGFVETVGDCAVRTLVG